MRFPSEIEASDIQVELKYCERCGGLWLRPQGGGGVYCAECRASLAELSDRLKPADDGEVAARKVIRRKARLHISKAQRREKNQRPARIESLEGVATAGGQL